MKISFHTCKGRINKPHKPELNKRIKSFKDGLRLLRKYNKDGAVGIILNVDIQKVNRKIDRNKNNLQNYLTFNNNRYIFVLIEVKEGMMFYTWRQWKRIRIDACDSRNNTSIWHKTHPIKPRLSFKEYMKSIMRQLSYVFYIDRFISIFVKEEKIDIDNLIV